MNAECIICFEIVDKQEKFETECGCKYTAHLECISKWNDKCVLCNHPTKPVYNSYTHDIILERIIKFVIFCIVVSGIYTILVITNFHL